MYEYLNILNIYIIIDLEVVDPIRANFNGSTGLQLKFAHNFHSHCHSYSRAHFHSFTIKCSFTVTLLDTFTFTVTIDGHTGTVVHTVLAFVFFPHFFDCRFVEILGSLEQCEHTQKVRLRVPVLVCQMLC